jgi:nucleoside 2-deoxyribosyltransferase
MAFDTRAYRILVASPSDVVEERDAPVRVMHDWNNLHSYNRRVVLLPLRWETHTAPEYNVRPQEAINRRIVDDCDLVVGIFWTRLGSPTGEADSGTLEEIERAAKAGKPVMLYFSQVPVAPERVDTNQIERLRKFRDAVLASALVESFRSALEFRDKFAAALELKIRDLQRADEVGQPSPLDLQFVSLDDGQLLGAQLKVGLRVPENVSPPATAERELGRHYSVALREAQHKAGTVPILLGVKNAGNVGIRNLFIEISIRPVDGACAVSTLPRRPSVWSSDVIYSVTSIAEEGDSSDEYEVKLAKLTGKGLSEEEGEWKLRLEWEALQPQRVRFVEPLILLTFSKSAKVEIVARVYAESFASPLTLQAQVNPSG